MSDCPFGEGIFVWGVIKNIMYWGVYVYYTSMKCAVSVHKDVLKRRRFVYKLIGEKGG